MSATNNTRASLSALTGYLLLSLLALLSLGYWAWLQWNTAKVEEIIPDHAVLVVQVPEIGKTKEALASTAAGQRLLAFPSIQRLYGQLQQLDSLAASEAASPWAAPLNTALYEQPLWLSLHRESKHAMGWVGYAQIPAFFEKKQSLSRLLQAFPQTAPTQGAWRQRSYRSFPIYDYVDSLSNKVIYCAGRYKNQALISSSPILVEEAIRKAEGVSKPKINAIPPNLYQQSQGISFYWNGYQANELLKAFGWEGTQEWPYGWVGTLSFEKAQVQVKARAHSPHGQDLWKRSLPKIQAAKTGLSNLLPPSTAWTMRREMADGQQWWRQWGQWLDQSLPPKDELTEGFLESLSQEWALLQSPGESPSPEESAPLLLIQADSAQFQEWAQTLPAMGQLPTDCALQQALSQLPSWPQKTFLTYERGYIALGQSQQQLALWRRATTEMAAMEVADTPAGSPSRPNKSLDAPFWLEWNSQRAWPWVLAKSNPQWRQWLEERQVAFLQFRQGQLSVDPESGLEISIQVSPAADIATAGESPFTPVFQVELPVEGKSAPQLYPNNGPVESTQVFFQDRWNNIKQATPQGRILWSVHAGKSSAFPLVHPFKDLRSSQQGIAFTAENQLWMRDLKGKGLRGGKRYLPFAPLHTNLLHTATGRALVGLDDPLGNAYLYGISGRAVAPWKPFRYNTPLIKPLEMLNVAGETVVLALQKGSLQAHTLEGEALPGFPLPFSNLYFKDWIIEEGNTAANTEVWLLASRGRTACINLNGQIVKTMQLPARSLEDDFFLLNSHTGTGRTGTGRTGTGRTGTGRWYWARREPLNGGERWHLYSKQGQELLTINAPHKGGELQYFNFGGGREFLAVSWEDRKSTQLYYFNGQPCGEPFSSQGPIALKYRSKPEALLVYRFVGKALRADWLNFRQIE